MLELTPRQIVEELDKYIVGQKEAKRAIAVAIRNRWRRQRVEPEMRGEIGPKNMMMIGPTGVGKTEIARRLASLTGAPFIKVDATKYTEVGYYGRDVESMARELVENAIGIVRAEEREKCAEKAKDAAEKRIVDLLVEKFERENRERERRESVAKRLAARNAASTGTGGSAQTGDSADASNSTDSAVFDSGSGTTDSSIDPELAAKWREVRAVKFDPRDPAASFDALSKAFRKAFDPNDPNGSFRAAAKTFGLPPDVFGVSTGNGENASTLPSDSNGRGAGSGFDSDSDSIAFDAASRPRVVDRAEIETRLRLGEYETTTVPVVEERKSGPVIMGGVGFDGMSDELQNMLESIAPKRSSRRETPVSDARKIFVEQETERLLDKEKIDARAIDLAENLGIIFIDEIDKIVGSEGGRGADVSRQGVQRDLLPIVEGTTIRTKYGLFSTEHVLFIAAGAFHRVKPSDLTPELQGRFPIRVELSELTKDDFVRILTEPKSALTKQYAALMKTENVELVFEPDAIDALATYAAETNLTTQNIGARRLCTIMELLLEDLNFEAPEMGIGRVVVNAAYVREKIDRVAKDEDLSKFVL